MSARFLFTCWPFEGHVFPQMSIAKALESRANEVAFYTGDRLRATIEQQGVRVFPFERVEERWASVQTLERERAGRKQSLRIEHRAFRDWLVETIPAQVGDLQSIMQSWKPDVLVTDVSMLGPIVILSEATVVPVAVSSTLMGPLTPGSDAPPWGFGLPPPRTAAARVRTRALNRTIDLIASGLRRRVDELRAEHGLSRLGCSVNAYTGRLPLYLVGNIPELDYDRRDVPAGVHYVGPCTWNPPSDAATAAWLDTLPTERPWVHVTEGTSHYQDPFLLRSSAAGLNGQPVEAILTTGHQRDPAALGLEAPAPNIHVTRWASHVELLPRCAAVVTTGGPATIMAALQAGVPLVVVPTTWDKPDNAGRVVDAGVGVRLAPKRCTPTTLRAAVDEVLGNTKYRANARRAAERLAGAPGPVGAAELLEGLRAGRVPVT